MLADATGAMPPTLVIEADQRFLSDGLDCASVLVHGRNSHEKQPQSPQRRQLIATRTIEAIAAAPDQPKALLWNPAGLSLEKAAELLGVRHGTVAILGGTKIFALFLPRYDVFYLSCRATFVRRAANIPAGSATQCRRGSRLKQLSTGCATAFRCGAWRYIIHLVPPERPGGCLRTSLLENSCRSFLQWQWKKGARPLLIGAKCFAARTQHMIFERRDARYVYQHPIHASWRG